MTTNTTKVLWMNNNNFRIYKNYLVFNVRDDDDNNGSGGFVHESARMYSSPEMRQTHAPKFQRRDNYTICFNWACCLWFRFKFKFLPHNKTLFTGHTHSYAYGFALFIELLFILFLSFSLSLSLARLLSFSLTPLSIS